MEKLAQILRKAENSKFYLWLTNFVLLRFIPFNAPHNLRIVSIKKEKVEIRIPYKKSNLNHIKGLHACCLATVSEYATGLLLLYNLNSTNYRIIMQSLNMQFHYQGKTDGMASFSVTDEWMQHNILEPLKTNDAILVTCEAKVFDTNNNHLTTCATTWQIKKWDKVQLKVT